MKEVNSVSDATNTYGEDIKLTTTDASTLYKTIITELEKGAGEPLYPGDERRIFGEALVPVFVALYNSLNDVGRQTLLRYARGEVLDAIGERQDVKRLEGTPAKTTMRFSVSTPQERNIIIPKWTKVTPDSENYFATDEIAVLQAGAYSVEVPTSAVSNGTKFNGYAAGTIATLVDLIPYIESVTNLTETAGGDDGEPYTTEGDNRLRERIRLAPAKRSTAGPEQAYIYWVMTADSSIVDAKAVSEKETVSETLTVYDGKAFKGGGALLTDSLVVKAHGQSTAAAKDTDYTVDYTDDLLTITLKGSLSAAESIDIIITRTLEGCVKIVPLLEGGGIPDAAMLAKVLDVVNAKDIRPLTDKVSAVPPEVETYDIEIVYYTTPESEAEVIANVEGTGGAIDRYNEWQVAALGRDINPDQLRKRILSPSWGENLTGAFRVDVVKPTYHAKDPKPGDQIFFSTAHSKSNVSHTGLVEKVDGSKVYTIEGNTSDQVARRSYYLSDNYIVGYGRPAYDAEPGNANTGSQTPSGGTTSEVTYTVVAGDTLSKIAAKYGTTYQKLAAYNGITNPNIIRVGQKIKIPGTAAPKKTIAEIAKEVIAGKWGNGADRKKRLEAAGYDYNAVQQAVNAALAR